MFDAIIISDIHLGSEVCRASEVLSFLKKIQRGEIVTERLIINGDLFDNKNVIKRSHKEILSLLKELPTEVIWVLGNHDEPLGLVVQKEYQFRSGLSTVICVHGDIFDDFITHHPLVARAADSCYRLLQKIMPARACLWLKAKSKIYCRCKESVRNGAIRLALERGCQIVCSGHVHSTENYSSENVLYLNSGCWTESPCHYVTIKDGHGSVEQF